MNLWTELRTVSRKLSMPMRLMPIAILFGLVGLLLWSVSQGDKGVATPSAPSEHRTADTAAPTVPAPQPPVDEVTLHPYDLLRNPYAHRNHVISMDAASWPILYNGQVMQYTEARSATASRLGYTGIRLNRMLSENTALYDVMGSHVGGGSELELLGELAVQGASSAELDIERHWDVEPLEVLEATNGFGAPIQLPKVRFWRYTDERYRSTQNRVAK